MPLIHQQVTNLQRRLHKGLVDSGWVTERKPQATFVVTAPWMRYQCDVVEGKSKKPDDRLAKQIDYHLRAFAKCSWTWIAKRHADKAFAITERAMSLGHVRDLTDPRTSTPWVRRWVLPYTIGFAVGKTMPGPDLELSNFEEDSWVYHEPGIELNIRGFKDSEGLISDLWGCPVLISTYPGLPQAIWIRPVQLEQQAQVDPEVLADFENLGEVDELSLGMSLVSRGKEIVWRFDEDEDVWHLLIIGQTRSRKSTLAKNICFMCRRAKRQVSDVIWIDGDMGAPGMKKLIDIGVVLANTPEQVAAQLARIEEIKEERNAIMHANNWDRWPGPRVVVVLDETQKLLKDKRLDTKAIELLPTTVAKYGIWVICITPKATDKEGPVLFWAAYQWRIMMRVDEEVAPTQVFHRDKTKFDFHPVNMTPGQFVMRRPGSLQLEYGTIHPPMVNANSARKD